MTNPLQIIALTGLAGTGKDTAADILVTHCGFTKLAFAAALRTEVQAAFNVPAELLTRRDLKEMPTAALALVECTDMGFIGALVRANATNNVRFDVPAWFRGSLSPRQVMQLWGTEYRRAQRVNYWLDLLREHLKACMGYQQTAENSFSARRRHLEALRQASTASDSPPPATSTSGSTAVCTPTLIRPFMASAWVMRRPNTSSIPSKAAHSAVVPAHSGGRTAAAAGATDHSISTASTNVVTTNTQSTVLTTRTKPTCSSNSRKVDCSRGSMSLTWRSVSHMNFGSSVRPGKAPCTLASRSGRSFKAAQIGRAHV